jgi:hypothetical protein
MTLAVKFLTENPLALAQLKVHKTNYWLVIHEFKDRMHKIS